MTRGPSVSRAGSGIATAPRMGGVERMGIISAPRAPERSGGTSSRLNGRGLIGLSEFKPVVPSVGKEGPVSLKSVTNSFESLPYSPRALDTNSRSSTDKGNTLDTKKAYPRMTRSSLAFVDIIPERRSQVKKDIGQPLDIPRMSDFVQPAKPEISPITLTHSNEISRNLPNALIRNLSSRSLQAPVRYVDAPIPRIIVRDNITSKQSVKLKDAQSLPPAVSKEVPPSQQVRHVQEKTAQVIGLSHVQQEVRAPILLFQSRVEQRIVPEQTVQTTQAQRIAVHEEDAPIPNPNSGPLVSRIEIVRSRLKKLDDEDRDVIKTFAPELQTVPTQITQNERHLRVVTDLLQAQPQPLEATKVTVAQALGTENPQPKKTPQSHDVSQGAVVLDLLRRKLEQKEEAAQQNVASEKQGEQTEETELDTDRKERKGIILFILKQVNKLRKPRGQDNTEYIVDQPVQKARKEFFRSLLKRLRPKESEYDAIDNNSGTDESSATSDLMSSFALAIGLKHDGSLTEVNKDIQGSGENLSPSQVDVIVDLKPAVAVNKKGEKVDKSDVERVVGGPIPVRAPQAA